MPTYCFVLSFIFSLGRANLVLIAPRDNQTIEFEDAEASFGLEITDHTPVGKIVDVSPGDACSPLEPPPPSLPKENFFALINRGGCTFADKVLAAQNANYSAAIVVNNISDNVFPMSSSESIDISIPAIMIGRKSGLIIAQNYLYISDYVARIKPNPESTIQYYLVPFLITLSLAFFGIIIFLACRAILTCLRKSKNRLSREVLNKLPEIRFSEDYQNLYDTCAICLEDYAMGDKIRVLPCHHAYHSKCVDRWLLRRQSSCPVCKYRIRTGRDDDRENGTEVEDEEATEGGVPSTDGQPPGTARAVVEHLHEEDESRVDETAPLLPNDIRAAPTTTDTHNDGCRGAASMGDVGSGTWLSGGQLPSQGHTWLGYDNHGAETAEDEDGLTKQPLEATLAVIFQPPPPSSSLSPDTTAPETSTQAEGPPTSQPPQSPSPSTNIIV